ncbi:rpa-associated protein [Haloferax sp. MBLA0076]|uniref:Rpa-associated protein n=1 Tax=Haloferax litoreum TaxID=2666140 RepID=A0A6A8GMN3_9EURY|nr:MULTISPECIES: rpa-associated protein [Haloferax]KAB1194433.1 rpa-associated protein [Haloferax sp. CBA1148]MRX23000.1 rpa-associated protein [Haloferax litoreum]
MSSSPVVGTREVAYRVFAAEFDDASLSYSESDEERAPNYVVTPTGARLNRTFVAGALTEVEHVNDEVLRGRIADPTGAFVTYAGQYQPDPMAFLDQATPPAFVALAGKARTYEPDDADVVYTSIRPESINTVDADVRDRWLVTTAEATLDRIAVFDEALSMPQRGDELRRALEARGVESTLAAGIPRAIDHYGTTRAYLEAVRTLAVQALELVAGERDHVENLAVSPGDDGDATLGRLPELDLLPADSVDVASAPEADADPAESEGVETETADAEAVDAEAETADAEAETVDAGETESVASAADTEPVSDVDSEPVAETETEPVAEPVTEPDSEPIAAEATTETTETESPTEPSTLDADDETPSATTTSADETPSADTVESDVTADTDPSVESDSSGTLGDFDDGVADDDPLDEPELDELGDFDDDLPDIDETDSEADTGAVADPAETADTDASASDVTDPSGMYEMGDEERAEIESEFGTEFTTGTDVDPAGEADIDVPDVDELESESAADAEPASAAEPEPSSEPEPASESDDAEPESTDVTPAEDVDLESAVVATMEDIDDGDGAAHDDVVAAVVDEYGVDADAVEDAIQDALLGGRCYEPQDDVLKAI